MVDMPIHVTTETHTKKVEIKFLIEICFLAFAVENSLIMIFLL
jgi:hypothetical protein